jgi:hypothetical protein
MKVQILYYFNERQRQEVFARPLQKLLTANRSLFIRFMKTHITPNNVRADLHLTTRERILKEKRNIAPYAEEDTPTSCEKE